jgi:hypothetical protein
MLGLSDVEVKALESSTDPAVVAATKKLKEVVESGEFIPKSRLNDEIKQAKDLQKKLALIEDAQKKADEEKARQNGELDKLLKTRETELATVTQLLETEKKDAEAYRKLRTSALETYKKQMGDTWDDSMALLPLETLAKLSGSTVTPLGVFAPAGKPPEVKPERKQLEEKLVAAQKAGKLTEVVALRNQLTQLAS